MLQSKQSERLIALDYLRGFFIIVITIDHLSRWPSMLSIFTGMGLLWITAAEGFVIISGLLIGYVRGFKNQAESIVSVSKKLLKRAGILYLWSIIATIVYTSIIWYLPLQGGTPGLVFDRGDYWGLFIGVATFQETYVWVYFLTLYALFLAVSPLAIWLLRRRQAWLVVLISLMTLVVGRLIDNEPMQWQALFFIPSVAGYYLEAITGWWQKLTDTRKRLIDVSIISVTALTIALSVVSTFSPLVLSGFAQTLNGLFEKDTISMWRLGLSFVWFTGFALVFIGLRKVIGRLLGWLLYPIGTRSLTAYIVHGLPIVAISFFTLSSTNIIINSLLGIVCVLIVWILVRLRIVQKIIPR